MLVGSQVMEVAKAQQKELKKTRKQLAREQQQQAELQMKLQEEEEEANAMAQTFQSLQQELDFKTNKLTKLWESLQVANRELQGINEDFDRERNDMYDTIYELTN